MASSKSGDHVGCGRAAGHDRHTRLAGCMGVARRHVTGSLLMAHQDMTNTRLDQWVVYGQDGTTGHAKYGLYALMLQRFEHRLGSVNLHHSPALFSSIVISV